MSFLRIFDSHNHPDMLFNRTSVSRLNDFVKFSGYDDEQYAGCIREAVNQICLKQIH